MLHCNIAYAQNGCAPTGVRGQPGGIAGFLAAWQAKPEPSIDRPLVAVFAGNHGVVEKGMSAYPASVTRAMMDNFIAGGAAINQICAGRRSFA